jgi:HK97 family phage prohead protease
MTTRETHTVKAAEIRFADDNAGTFTGYAAIFGEPNSFGEIVKRGAFAKTLKTRNGPVAMFWNHDPAAPIGVWSEITEDQRGLKVTGKLVTETTRGAEALALLKAKAVNGLSIGFRARQQERGPNGARVLTDVELVEISLVSLPAASRARVTSVRNAAPADVSQFVAACRSTATAFKR